MSQKFNYKLYIYKIFYSKNLYIFTLVTLFILKQYPHQISFFSVPMNFGQFNVLLAFDNKIYNKQHISSQQFNKKKSEIENLALSLNIKISGLPYRLQSFPDKFSVDLYDIEKTIKIQDNLLNIIKKNQENQNNFHVQILSLHNHIHELERQKLNQQKQHKKKLQQQQNIYVETKRSYQQLLQKYNALKDKDKLNQKKIIQLQYSKNQFKREILQREQKISKLKLQLSKQQEKHKNNQNANRANFTNKGNGNKTMQIFNGGLYQKQTQEADQANQNKRTIIINSNDKIQKISQASTLLVKAQYQQLKADFNKMARQNQILKQWIDHFVSSIKRVLCVRKEQLKNMKQPQKQRYIQKNYISQCVQGNTLFLKQGFPYAKMLSQFQFLAKQAQKSHLQKQCSDLSSKNQKINIKLVEKIVHNLFNIRSSLIRHVQRTGYRRQDLKKKYQDFLPFLKEASFDQIISECSFQQLQKFQDNTWQVLQSMENQITMFNQQIEQIISHSQFKKLSELNKIDQVVRDIQKCYSYFKNLEVDQQKIIDKKMKEWKSEFYGLGQKQEAKRQQAQKLIGNNIETNYITSQSMKNAKANSNNQIELNPQQVKQLQQQKRRLKFENKMKLRFKYCQQWIKQEQNNQEKQNKFKQLEKRFLDRQKARQQENILLKDEKIVFQNKFAAQNIRNEGMRIDNTNNRFTNDNPRGNNIDRNHPNSTLENKDYQI